MKHSVVYTLALLVLASCTPGDTTPNGMMDHGQMGNGMMNQGNADGSFLPGEGIDIASLPEAKPSEVIEVQDGETISLNPMLIRKNLNGEEFAMYGYNGQFPGPTFKVKQGSTFTVNVTNKIDQPTTVHWHGIRLENKFDGAAGVTQDPIEPGNSFTYTVTVPDEGIFWYHPHVREDLQQDMGLYGLLHVTPKDANAYPTVDREEYLIVDDILLSSGVPVAYGGQEADFALMGRFGNTFLINGETANSKDVQLGEVVRYYILNASNTRTYRVSGVPEARGMKLVAQDAGRAEKSEFIDSVILSPSERVVVDMNFLSEEVNTGTKTAISLPIISAGSPSVPVYSAKINGGIYDLSEQFSTEGENADVKADIDALRTYFDRAPDITMHLSVEQPMMGGMMMHDEANADGIEWEDPMPMMNAMSNKANTKWKLIDEETKNENMDIKYQFEVGDKVKIRIVNDKSEDGSDHPMQHPIHFHGQRFLVLSVNGEPTENLAWKDTVLVPKDATVDILLDVSNSGDWMIHCHIAEHLSNGMMGLFTVE